MLFATDLVHYHPLSKMLPEIGGFKGGQGCGSMVNKAHSASWRGLTILYKGEADNRIRDG